MHNVMFGLLIWLGASPIVAIALCTSITVSKRQQSDMFLAIRRDEWREGFSR